MEEYQKERMTYVTALTYREIEPWQRPERHMCFHPDIECENRTQIGCYVQVCPHDVNCRKDTIINYRAQVSMWCKPSKIGVGGQFH